MTCHMLLKEQPQKQTLPFVTPPQYTLGWTNNTQKRKNNPKCKNSKISRNMPKLAIYHLTRSPSRRVVSTMLCKAKLAKNNLFLFGNFRPLPNKDVQTWDHFFTLFFSKDSESEDWTLGCGCKMTFKGYLNKWTDRHTDRQRDTQTYEQINL